MKAAVILSGCGFLDGAEIRESVLALLYLDQLNVAAEIFAPDLAFDTVDHLTGKPAGERRNVLQEAARIARGHIRPLQECRADGYDLLVLPGGFGVAKNLSNFAAAGAQAQLETEFARVANEFHAQKKPIAAICIAPAALALALKGEGVTLTIGDNKDVAEAIRASGNRHQDCATDRAVIDEAHRIASCSAYMRDDPLGLIARGIEQCVGAAVRMAQQKLRAA
jgi:enhancing lycopene biosynthesis protein 2